jgi:hypothetical protein
MRQIIYASSAIAMITKFYNKTNFYVAVVAFFLSSIVDCGAQKVKLLQNDPMLRVITRINL